MTEVVATAIATVVAALVAGLAGHFTAKSSAKGAVKAAQVTSLSELEREAGKRAFEYYEGVLTRMKQEHADDREEARLEREEDRLEIEQLKKEKQSDRDEIRKLRQDIAKCHATCRALARRLDGRDAADPDHRP